MRERHEIKSQALQQQERDANGLNKYSVSVRSFGTSCPIHAMPEAALAPSISVFYFTGRRIDRTFLSISRLGSTHLTLQPIPVPGGAFARDIIACSPLNFETFSLSFGSRINHECASGNQQKFQVGSTPFGFGFKARKEFTHSFQGDQG
ncbi:hypothetical protein NE237_003406 [Protea cynaroides]|uniref:Uncharacterized protein n=1 Tax=Protea cynaroides TaxID=273540 RepID=A0A9Q0KGX5_9MAGN|nr:hypothetical protein NE237_003406 [Protea cynaroides]